MVPLSRPGDHFQSDRGGHVRKRRRGSLSFGISNQWLNANKATVADFIDEKSDFQIKSLILTSEVIPVSYISKIDSPLPIIAMSQIDTKGIQLLYQIVGVNKG
jgi:hypothetical protein